MTSKRPLFKKMGIIFLVMTITGATGRAQASGPVPEEQPVPDQDRAGKRPVTELSLQELLEMKVAVASKTAFSTREAPGIVTLITREEIRESGARDLIDVLRLVPGMEFGIDVRGVTSIGIRGNWAHEGKVLILWDGLMLNEILFPSVQLGNHYPVDLIDRVEIIRGPGSAVYGGMAELGVINIISIGAAGLNGIYAANTGGVMGRGGWRENFSLAAGRQTKDYGVDASLFAGRASRSGGIYTDYHPVNPHHSFEMAGQETLESFFFNAGFRAGGFRQRLIIDRYHVNDRTMYGTNLPSPVQVDFLSFLFDMAWEGRLNSRLKATPRFTYTRNTPWQCLDPDYQVPVYLDKWADRFTASLTMDYQIGPRINLLTGLEFSADTGQAKSRTYFSRDPARKKLSYTNAAVFGQLLLAHPVANLTAGVRLERNSSAGSSFVPRFAATRVWKRLHWKALYSFAFRPPGIENISRYASTPIKPEKTNVLEFEGGCQLSPHISVTANFFGIAMKDPIVFMVDPVLNVPAYRNGTRTGTVGAEGEFRLQTRPVSARLTYSFYRSRCNEVPDFVVESHPDLMLGFPKHKLTLNAKLALTQDISLNPSLVYLSERFASNNVTGTQFRERPVLLASLFLNFRHFPARGMTLGAGAFDLLGRGYRFIQPYPGGSAPLPGPAREFVVKLSFEHGF